MRKRHRQTIEYHSVGQAIFKQREHLAVCIYETSRNYFLFKKKPWSSWNWPSGAFSKTFDSVKNSFFRFFHKLLLVFLVGLDLVVLRFYISRIIHLKSQQINKYPSKCLWAPPFFSSIRSSGQNVKVRNMKDFN